MIVHQFLTSVLYIHNARASNVRALQPKLLPRASLQKCAKEDKDERGKTKWYLQNCVTGWACVWSLHTPRFDTMAESRVMKRWSRTTTKKYENVTKWPSYLSWCSHNMAGYERLPYTKAMNCICRYTRRFDCVFEFKKREPLFFIRFLLFDLFAHFVSWTRAMQLLLNHFIHFYAHAEFFIGFFRHLLACALDNKCGKWIYDFLSKKKKRWMAIAAENGHTTANDSTIIYYCKIAVFLFLFCN